MTKALSESADENPSDIPRAILRRPWVNSPADIAALFEHNLEFPHGPEPRVLGRELVRETLYQVSISNDPEIFREAEERLLALVDTGYSTKGEVIEQARRYFVKGTGTGIGRVIGALVENHEGLNKILFDELTEILWRPCLRSDFVSGAEGDIRYRIVEQRLDSAVGVTLGYLSRHPEVSEEVSELVRVQMEYPSFRFFKKIVERLTQYLENEGESSTTFAQNLIIDSVDLLAAFRYRDSTSETAEGISRFLRSVYRNAAEEAEFQQFSNVHVEALKFADTMGFSIIERDLVALVRQHGEGAANAIASELASQSDDFKTRWEVEKVARVIISCSAVSEGAARTFHRKDLYDYFVITRALYAEKKEKTPTDLGPEVDKVIDLLAGDRKGILKEYRAEMHAAFSALLGMETVAGIQILARDVISTAESADHAKVVPLLFAKAALSKIHEVSGKGSELAKIAMLIEFVCSEASKTGIPFGSSLRTLDIGRLLQRENLLQSGAVKTVIGRAVQAIESNIEACDKS